MSAAVHDGKLTLPAPRPCSAFAIPYPSLTPAQVAVAQALVASTRWTWGSHAIALRPDGALVEFTPGRMYSRERCQQEGLVPFITDQAVVGHLVAQLDAACGPGVVFTMGRGDEGYRCELVAGPHRWSWAGTCLGEAVGQALAARWRAMDRGRHVPPGEHHPEPQGWVQRMPAQALARRGA